jgi:hypothetical protein
MTSENSGEIDRLSGVTDGRIHDLRRTVVTDMARLGVPPHIGRYQESQSPECHNLRCARRLPRARVSG